MQERGIGTTYLFSYPLQDGETSYMVNNMFQGFGLGVIGLMKDGSVVRYYETIKSVLEFPDAQLITNTRGIGLAAVVDVLRFAGRIASAGHATQVLYNHNKAFLPQEVQQH